MATTQTARALVAPRLLDTAEHLLRTRLPIRVTAWDGSTAGPPDATTTAVLRSPDALRRLLWAPGELGLARAYVAGDLDIDGDLLTALNDLADAVANAPRRFVGRDLGRLLARAVALGGLRPPPPPPATEARPRSGTRHSPGRDATAIQHHYDVGDDFYSLFLGQTMAYSCAYWPDGVTTLDEAQRAKFDLVCRKLDLREGTRVLDVGCGWGGFVEYAAREYGVSAVGITLSPSQAEHATHRIERAGLADRVRIRLEDYRAVTDGPYDAVVSIGMAEHVGTARLATYAAALYRLLRPQGRVLHHAIAAREGARRPRATFIDRYIFPDGELQPLGVAVRALESAGLEVRDAQSLREHYARTLERWTANLRDRWNRAVELVGAERARVWRLYLAASSVAFAHNRIGVNQVLAVRPDRHGGSGMPAQRAV